MKRTADGLQALEAELGAGVPPGFRQLSAEQLHDLAEAVAEARRRQAAEIAGAADQALKHVPRLLRVAIRKVTG